MRKQPRQARSRATIEAILQASARILEAHGWQALTTNSVAELAGVSIGSLYQYFPNKLALIEGVRRGHFDEILGLLEQAGGGRMSRQERIETLVDGMIAAHARNPAMHRVLLEDAPRGSASQWVHDEFEKGYIECYDRLIRLLNPRLPDCDRALRSTIMSAALSGAIHDAARRNLLASEKFRQELIGLAMSYCRVAVQPVL